VAAAQKAPTQKASTSAAAAAVASAAEDRAVKSLRSASSSNSSSSAGSRKLLLAAAAAAEEAAAPLQAQVVYAIRTSNDYWASKSAIADKLLASAEPPGYTFYSNLQVRGLTRFDRV
jgi:hypothetical protein